MKSRIRPPLNLTSSEIRGRVRSRRPQDIEGADEDLPDAEDEDDLDIPESPVAEASETVIVAEPDYAPEPVVEPESPQEAPPEVPTAFDPIPDAEPAYVPEPEFMSLTPPPEPSAPVAPDKIGAYRPEARAELKPDNRKKTPPTSLRSGSSPKA